MCLRTSGRVRVRTEEEESDDGKMDNGESAAIRKMTGYLYNLAVT